MPRFWYLPARRQGRRRDDRRRPRLRRHRRPLRPVHRGEPGRLLGGRLGVRALDVVHLSRPARSPTPRRRATSRQGFEIALHARRPASTSSTAPTGRRRSLPGIFDTQLAAFRSKYTSVPAPATQRMHCVAWADWATQPKVELANGIRLDTNYYYYPSAWMATKPGLHDRLGHADALRRHRRQPDRRLPGQHRDHRRVRAGGAEHGQRAARQRARRRTATTAPSSPTSTPTPPRRRESDAIVAAAQARGVPVISAKQLLDWTDGPRGVVALRRSAGRATR